MPTESPHPCGRTNSLKKAVALNVSLRLMDVCVSNSPGAGGRRKDDEGVMLMPNLDIGLGPKRIDIVRGRKLRRIRRLNKKSPAYRFRRFDNAPDDLVPAGGVDNGVIDRRDEIIVVSHGEPPARRPIEAQFARPS
jgi:hypothetical protein